MMVRRGVVTGLIGLALVAGATGCGKVSEKVAERAIEESSDCEGVDVDIEEGGFQGTCGGDEIGANASGNADLPTEWPADLAPPAGFNILAATDTPGPPRTLSINGGMDGDVATVYGTIKTQLEAAGYTIDTDSLAEGSSGPSGSLTATGPEFTALVAVSDAPVTTEGAVAVSFSLTAIG